VDDVNGWVYAAGVPAGAPVTIYNAKPSQVDGPAKWMITILSDLGPWDSNHLLRYFAYVPQITNWNIPTPDPYRLVSSEVMFTKVSPIIAAGQMFRF
jgi:hypothetical protein